VRVEAVAELLRASVELRLRRNTAALLGEPERDDPGPVDPARLSEAKRVGHVVGAGAARLPWHPSCLRQALAAQRMLRRRGIPSRLHLGVIAGGEAHAWVTVGDRAVIGGGGSDRFVPLAAFGQR
jgi:hypothetical protein